MIYNEKMQEWLANTGSNASFVHRDIREWAEGMRGDPRTIITVFASGASLMRISDKIEEIADKTICVVSPTVYPWFRWFAGKDPDLIVNVDKHPMLPKLCWETSAPVLLHPGVSPEWLSVPCPTYWFLDVVQGSDGKFESHPYTMALRAMFPKIKTFVAQMGCVTNTMVWLMWSMSGIIGSTEGIVLAGADYSYWHNYARVPMEPPFDKYETTFDRPVDGLPITWNNIKTNGQMLRYANQLALIQEHHTMHLASVSDGLLNSFIPRISVKDLLRGRMPKYVRERLSRDAGRFVADFDVRAEK